MSVIKANKHQVGSNATVSKNIVLEANVDGDLVISKGVHDGTLTELAKIKNVGGMEYVPAGTGAVPTTVQTKLREIQVSVQDFLPRGIDYATYDCTSGIQAAFDAALRVEFIKGKVYRITGPLNITASGTYVIGNGARIVGDYEQDAVSPSYAESMINVTGADDVLIENLRLQYTGTFTIGGLDYGGYISGIHVEDSDRFTARNVEAYGLNRAGINVAMGAAYCKDPKVIDCYLHHNRVSGLIFGNTDNGIMQGCTLTHNGSVDSIGTGYGFSGWSACLPKNTILANNQANDNYRKGLDYHSGENGTIVGNVCARNRVYGIYVMGVKGSWTITGNTVTDMTWGNEFPTVAPYGIRVGDLVGQGTSEIPTSFVVDCNVISKMTKTAGDMFAFGDVMVGCSYGKLTISNNIVDVGVVSQIHTSGNGVTGGVEGNYFDIAFIGNQFTAAECTSTLSPINVRSAKSRQKIFSNNTVNITTAGSTGGVFSYDNSSITNRCLISIGNNISAPVGAWSAIYDPIYVRRVATETMSNTIVNGVRWRDWDGNRFILSGTGGAAPSTNYWTQGSVFWNTSVAAGGIPGFVCVTAGTPGTWKAMAAIAA